MAEKSQEQRKLEISQSENFPMEKMDEFVAWIQNEPYITGAGLQWKMLEVYGVGKFSVQATMPTENEYSLLRSMMGLNDEDPLVVMRGEVWVEGFDRPFIDYGTTSPKNLKGFVKFSDYPLEMATRRATNRAMRLATATGMCSVDEIQQAPLPKEADLPISQDQRDKIGALSISPLFTDEERDSLDDMVNSGMTRKVAVGIIAKLKTRLDDRTSKQQSVEA